ncbi:S-adenosyl-L-methionine-dependent methyltransferase [Penicillium riverlandense]|uniref:S-adenosyl-L-methionine-dependent methyltransferase n=1 Tax=Penicillium riverlandense TaxID=1903569 RepID=UPI002546AA91|nr:S-adenosyl-L-methionine-dependent methyltransferase [Penicillium riverlandense]XP_057048381.1 S-adenosyl-L-methionine-dependent methyltransferase [Penicillium riverlandense]KAJ5804834.1 S-adenosyl-L-methionine-dependent methyltransferase [Penicillium riverlandense]KAJ5807108.1 S-adenosyl-L-methionine-dependent methyltransferase [Penicillium riverlandense]
MASGHIDVVRNFMCPYLIFSHLDRQDPGYDSLEDSDWQSYQALKPEDYWSPSNDQQFEAYETGDVADMYPSAIVRGVDLFPPPVTWVPTNCIFEVDDLLQEWTWHRQFDFVYLRHMLGSFDNQGWATLYQQCYDNLEPGGWIEQMEFDIRVKSDDDTLQEDSVLANWGETFIGCAERAGRPLTIQETMRASIEKAGFVDVHEHIYKVPIGAWPRDKVLKEVGKLNYHHWVTGMEGYAMWLLTTFGAPSPWSPEAVQVYLAEVRAQLKDSHIHGYEYARRVWGRKPRDAEKKSNSTTREVTRRETRS